MVKATVLLMLDLGETPLKIALFLGIDDGTVYRHLENYQTNGLDKFLGNNYFGYFGKLDSFQIVELKKALKEHLYETCQEICELVQKRFSVKYTAEGMCELTRINANQKAILAHSKKYPQKIRADSR